jgi:hypothetical protein
VVEAVRQPVPTIAEPAPAEVRGVELEEAEGDVASSQEEGETTEAGDPPVAEVVDAPTPVPTRAAPTPRPTSRPPPAGAAAATKLEDISVRRIGDRTVVAVRANGSISENKVRVAPMKDPARVWIRIRGIETFYRPNEIQVGSPEVLRIRVGHHPEETPPSIYVVADLADAEAIVRGTSVRGDTLQVEIGLP